MSAHAHLTFVSAAIILTACATAQENPHYQHSTKYKGAAPSTAYASNGSLNTVSGNTVSGNSYTAANAPAGTVLARYVHEDSNHPLGDVPNSVSSGSLSSGSLSSGSTTYASNTGASASRQTLSQPIQHSGSYAAASYGRTTYASPSYSRIDAACIEQGAQGSAACTPAPLPIAGQSASIAAPYTGNPETLYVTSTTTTAALSPTEQAMPDSYGTPGYEAMKNAETAWNPVQSAPQQSADFALGVPVPTTQPFASPLPAPSMRQALSPDMMPRNEQSYTLGSQHVIAEGDTVYSYARSLCRSVDDIKAMNSLDSSFNIRLGDTIRLPASKC